MLLNRVVAAFIALLITLCQADVAALVSQLPSCASECLAASIEASICSPTNITCLCTNEQLIKQNTLCIVESCTIKQQLTTKNVTNTLCQVPIRDKSIVISATCLVGGALALVAFIMRIMARAWAGGTAFGMDDWTICLAMVLTIAFTSLSVPLANAGLGKDIWTLPFDFITRVLHIYYIDEILYLAIVTLVKMSFLFFYLRVFPGSNVRKVIIVLMACCLGYCIAFIVGSIFQCRPIDGAWNHWDGTPANCNDINAQAWANGAFNMTLDFAVLILPLPMMAKLTMTWKAKAEAMFMFSLGFFVSIISIVRLSQLIQFGSTTNFTWDMTELSYLSALEVHVGIICACLPAIRSLMRKLFPTAFAGGTCHTKTSIGPSSVTRGSSYDTIGRDLHKPGLSLDLTSIRLDDSHLERERSADIRQAF